MNLSEFHFLNEITEINTMFNLFSCAWRLLQKDLHHADSYFHIFLTNVMELNRMKSAVIYDRHHCKKKNNNTVIIQKDKTVVQKKILDLWESQKPSVIIISLKAERMQLLYLVETDLEFTISFLRSISEMRIDVWLCFLCC